MGANWSSDPRYLNRVVSQTAWVPAWISPVEQQLTPPTKLATARGGAPFRLEKS